MADRVVKQVGQHMKGCFAVKAVREGHWHTPWGPIAWGEHGEPVTKTWRRYGKNGRKLLTWVRFVCNHSGCPAELHVEGDFILTAAERRLSPKSRRA